ncbi:MAG: hypothetical protein LAO55_03760 [Acidobacteriia bacterium]|nr:hypothetical protein [Terriglobia bacterium]
MRKFRSSLVLCATICAVIVLALMVGAIAYGSSNLRLLSHGPVWPPDDDGNGGNIIGHGPVWPPDDDGNGGNIVAHGPVWPPDDDGNGGNVRLV